MNTTTNLSATTSPNGPINPQAAMDPETLIRQFLVDNFLYRDAGPSLGANESLLEKGLIDSTGILELVLFLETTFSLQVADDEVVPENLDSIARLVAYVHRKRAAATAA